MSERARGRRVAVVGAGPAGVYSAKTAAAHPDVAVVDVIDMLPTPFGLVRYGVAPDHPKTKMVTSALGKDLTGDKVRFLGNMLVGRDLTHEELVRHYDAIVYCTGARRDKDLGIPGEDVPGSHGAAEFVNWYSGHPDSPLTDFISDVSVAVVIGGGNVALDVTRMLARDAEDLAVTDVPDHVLSAFRRSRVTDVHLLLRRGPADARFTPVELRELGELPGVDVLVDPDSLVQVGDDESELPRQVRQNLALMRQWSQRPRSDAPRRVHFHFWSAPSAMLGEGHLTGVQVVASDPRAGKSQTVIEAGLALRAIGYAADPIEGLPFDEERAIVPNEDGRVTDLDGRRLPGIYVAGWLKRGPSGVIGTNRQDAAATVHGMLADLAELPPCDVPDTEALVETLADRGVQVTHWEGWERLEAHEEALGTARGARAVKLHERKQMVDIAARREG